MTLVVWTQSLSFGIPSIDQQHQKLVSLVNALHDAMAARHGQQVLGKILDDLVGYTVQHLAYEEALFAKHGFPEAASHSASHEQLKSKVGEFVEQFRGGRIALSASVLVFLQDWLTKHICNEDARYVPLFKEKGVR
jgi:hemerythrin